MMDKHIWRIIHESIGILVVASVISSLGGIGLETLRAQLAWLIPIVILLPALNDMIGDFGAIVASRFTVMLYKKEVHEKHFWRDRELHHLFFVIFGIAVLAAIYVACLSYFLALVRGFPFDLILIGKVLFISLLSTILLVSILFFICVLGGFYVYKHKHDPNNYLIPLATAFADLGSMVLLSILVAWLF